MQAPEEKTITMAEMCPLNSVIVNFMLKRKHLFLVRYGGIKICEWKSLNKLNFRHSLI